MLAERGAATDRKGGGRARQGHGVGGVREDLEFQTWLFGIGVRYLTGGSQSTMC